MMPRLTVPLKWPGGQSYAAPTLVENFPRHRHYVEPYAGGASVLLYRDPNDPKLWLPPHKGVSEVLNDIYGDLMNFWRVLRSPVLFPSFVRRCQATPLSRETWEEAAAMTAKPGGKTPLNAVKRAWAFFVTCRQSHAGTFKGFTSLTRNRLRRGVNGNASEWLGAVEGLAEVHARLQPVVLENMDALKLIEREDGEGTFFYLDPPFLHETRVSKNLYKHEMDEQDHMNLLRVLSRIEGTFMLSCYDSDLYRWHAASYRWEKRTFDLPNNQAGGKTKRRMEAVAYMNY